MLIRITTSALAVIFSLAAAPAYAEFESLNSSLILSGGYTKAQNACASPWLAYGVSSDGTCYENHTALRLAYNYQLRRYGDLKRATAIWAMLRHEERRLPTAHPPRGQ